MKKRFFQSVLNIGTPAVLLHVNDTPKNVCYMYYVILIKRLPQQINTF